MTVTTKRARKSTKVLVADQHDAHVIAFDAHKRDIAESDLDAVLAAIAPQTEPVIDIAPVIDAETVSETAPVLNLRDRALAFAQTDVDAMIADIEASFARRDDFEGSAANDSASSYAKARKNMLANRISVARAFLVLDVSSANVIERKVVENKMFNAKALDKVTEIAGFICGNTSKFQKVTQAFIACAMFYSSKNDGAIINRLNKNFLSNNSFDKLVSDKELADYLREYQHKFMTGGKDTQSSQVRNVLDVLGLAQIVTVERARGGIALNDTHEFYTLFHDRYMQHA